MNWNPTNYRLFGLLAACFVISLIPSQASYFYYIPGDIARYCIVGVLSILLSRSFGRTARELNNYNPATSLDAKRVNEQIKITSNFINSASVAFASIAVFSGFVVDRNPDYEAIVVATTLAVVVHISARKLVGHIKDENE